MYLEDDNDENEKNNNSNESNDIEVVLGDNSVLDDISPVGDMMNDLRPKDSVNNRKKVIIPTSKNKAQNKKEDHKNDESSNTDNK